MRIFPFNKRLFQLVACATIAGLAPASIPKAAAQSDRTEIGRADFFKPGIAPVRDTGAYDVTVVYFMDYQCPACRKHDGDIARVLKEDPRVRMIYRDTPIFGPKSEAAARAAIASQFQGKHGPFHRSLMQTSGGTDDAAIRAAARKAGVDWTRLQRDLEKRKGEIDRLIDWNMALSEAAGISGTPAFVVGETLADGALSYRGLKAEIADARAKGVKLGAGEPAAKPVAANPEPEADQPQPIPPNPEAEPQAASPEEAAAPEPVLARSTPRTAKDAAEKDEKPEPARSLPSWLAAVLVIALVASGTFISIRRKWSGKR